MSMAHTSVNSVDHLWSQLLNLQHNLNPRLYHLPLPSNQLRQFLSLNVSKPTRLMIPCMFLLFLLNMWLKKKTKLFA